MYREILQPGRIRVDDSSEQIELRLSGLVVDRGGNLEVHNPIYARVFDLAWVDNQLAQLRPDNRPLTNWITSNNCQSSYVLKGKDFQNVLTWALGKNLADIDYQFN